MKWQRTERYEVLHGGVRASSGAVPQYIIQEKLRPRACEFEQPLFFKWAFSLNNTSKSVLFPSS